jgi:hypothetical protein
MTSGTWRVWVSACSHRGALGPRRSLRRGVALSRGPIGALEGCACVLTAEVTRRGLRGVGCWDFFFLLVLSMPGRVGGACYGVGLLGQWLWVAWVCAESCLLLCCPLCKAMRMGWALYVGLCVCGSQRPLRSLFYLAVREIPYCSSLAAPFAPPGSSFPSSFHSTPHRLSIDALHFPSPPAEREKGG